MVLLAALACTRFYKEDDHPVFLVPQGSMFLEVPPDGLCFWACLYLAVGAEPSQVFGWYNRPRLASGCCSSAPDAERELKAVRAFALGLDVPEGTMPPGCRQRIVKGVSVTPADIAPWRGSSYGFHVSDRLSVDQLKAPAAALGFPSFLLKTPTVNTNMEPATINPARNGRLTSWECPSCFVRVSRLLRLVMRRCGVFQKTRVIWIDHMCGCGHAAAWMALATRQLTLFTFLKTPDYIDYHALSPVPC